MVAAAAAAAAAAAGRATRCGHEPVGEQLASRSHEDRQPSGRDRRSAGGEKAHDLGLKFLCARQTHASD